MINLSGWPLDDTQTAKLSNMSRPRVSGLVLQMRWRTGLSLIGAANAAKCPPNPLILFIGGAGSHYRTRLHGRIPCKWRFCRDFSLNHGNSRSFSRDFRSAYEALPLE